jgi:hypothetical protein
MDEAERVVSDMEAKAVRWNAALSARLPAFLASCFLSSPRRSPTASSSSSSSSGCAPPVFFLCYRIGSHVQIDCGLVALA